MGRLFAETTNSQCLPAATQRIDLGRHVTGHIVGLRAGQSDPRPAAKEILFSGTYSAVMNLQGPSASTLTWARSVLTREPLAQRGVVERMTRPSELTSAP